MTQIFWSRRLSSLKGRQNKLLPSPKSAHARPLPYSRGRETAREREREKEKRERKRGKLAALNRSENSAASRLKMVANSYTVGMGLTALACIIFPALAIANQRTNSQSILQR